MSIFDGLIANALGGNGGGGGGGGSSDFSTAQVTVTYSIPYAVYTGWFFHVTEYAMFSQVTVETEATSVTETFDVVLYKGSCFMYFDNGEPDYTMYTNITVTGDIEADEEGYITITGNGTITIS